MRDSHGDGNYGYLDDSKSLIIFSKYLKIATKDKDVRAVLAVKTMLLKNTFLEAYCTLKVKNC